MNLVLDYLLPVELKNKNDGRGHAWYRDDKVKKQLRDRLVDCARLRPFPWPVEIVITRILGKRQKLWDHDSIGRGNAKELLDTLTDLGWWKDDGPRYIKRVDYRQDDSRRAEGPCVRIQVYRSEQK